MDSNKSSASPQSDQSLSLPPEETLYSWLPIGRMTAQTDGAHINLYPLLVRVYSNFKYRQA